MLPSFCTRLTLIQGMEFHLINFLINFFFYKLFLNEYKKNRTSPLMAPVIRILTMIKAEQFEEN